MSWAESFWTFSFWKIFTKCFRQDQPVTTQGRPGVSSFHLFRIQVQYLGSSSADRRLTEELFLPGRSFFRSLRTFGKPRPRRAWFFTTSTDSCPGSANIAYVFCYSVLPLEFERSADEIMLWNATNPSNPQSPDSPELRCSQYGPASLVCLVTLIPKVWRRLTLLLRVLRWLVILPVTLTTF